MISPSHNINITTAFAEDIKISFQTLMPYGKLKRLVEGDSIVVEGEKCDGLYFVQSGIFRTYRENNDVEYTTGFSFTGDFETSPFSLFYNTPCQETIQAITDAEVIYFDKHSILVSAENDFKIQHGYILLLSAYIEILETRLHQHRSLTSEQRYLLLCQQQPNEISRIPLQFIASFLGITKERLSRIRKKTSN